MYAKVRERVADEDEKDIGEVKKDQRQHEFVKYGCQALSNKSPNCIGVYEETNEGQNAAGDAV